MGEMIGVYHTDAQQGRTRKAAVGDRLPRLPAFQPAATAAAQGLGLHRGRNGHSHRHARYDGETVAKINEWLEVNGYEVAGPVLENILISTPASPIGAGSGSRSGSPAGKSSVRGGGLSPPYFSNL